MRVWRWFLREFYHILPVFIYFTLAFNLITLTENLIFKSLGLTLVSWIQATLAALVVTKVLLVIDHLPWIDLFPNRPLILTVIWKTGIYWFISLFVRLSIRFFPFLYSGGGVVAEMRDFFLNIDWNFFAGVQGFYLMLFFLFVTFRELIGKIGPRKVRKLFFGF